MKMILIFNKINGVRMKALFVLSLLCLLSTSAFAGKVNVDIKGMTCQMCVKSITKELTSTKKVKDVTVSLENKMASFETVGTAELTDAEIKTAIKNAGYEATAIKRQ